MEKNDDSKLDLGFYLCFSRALPELADEDEMTRKDEMMRKKKRGPRVMRVGSN